ncbi:SRPBCC domain-containing protein [Pseudonocardia humida]|uniref:SRPBCC domain-containing protein n=1 Tax=Pseudonocardia humida TaxID=2800819 RepID=A0ABT1A9M9_9PSEU|nr:SRPBCC domain-containing protein [Pseudonocardia humida]MCO1659746.1 SRPBCC domain-containing protein [Pseudonocardia humida]
MRILESTITIPAPPMVVWQVLTDLDRYAEWNPFVLEASGTVAVGETLRVRIRPEGGKAMEFSPTVTAAEPGRRFAWLGRLWGISGLFDGAHRFDLAPAGGEAAGATRLVHGEDFRGVLVPLVLRSAAAGTQAGFAAMNNALAARVAQIDAQGPA